MILQLLFINLIVALVYLSGFWDTLDAEINRRFKFRHIPHLLSCALCQCWWLSLLFIIVTGNLTLLNIFLCLVNAHLTKITIPLYNSLENILLGLVNRVNQVIDLIFFK